MDNQGELIWGSQVFASWCFHVLEGVFLARAHHLGIESPLMTPSFCMIVQGSKEFLRVISRYIRPNHYLIYALELHQLARSGSDTRTTYFSLRRN
jgi:hypothetical protein